MIDLKDLLLFLKRPYSEPRIDVVSIYSFFKLVGESIFIIFLIEISTSVAILIPLKHFNLLPATQNLTFNTFNALKISIILPVLEELIFRLPLKLSKSNIAIFLSLLLFVILNKLNFYLALSSSFLLFTFLLFIIKSEYLYYSRLYTKYNNNFLAFFYLQAFIFGTLHLTNYQLYIKYIYLFPLIVINYILIGCFLGYIRVRYAYGIFACIVTHIVINSLYYLINF